MNNYSGRLALQQRVLPSYRVPFFDLLAQSCESMSLFAGQAAPRGNDRKRQASNCKISRSKKYSFVQRRILSLLSTWIYELARRMESRCPDRGSESALSVHAFRCQVDARPRTKSHRLGAGFAVSLRTGGRVVRIAFHPSIRRDASRTVNAARMNMPPLVFRVKKYSWRIIQFRQRRRIQCLRPFDL